MYYYSLYSLTNHLVLVHILATQLFIRYVSSLNLTNAYLNHKCFVDQGTYKPGSQFEKDLNEAIKSVSTTKLMRGYVAISSSGEKKAITIVLQCRGDTDDPKCRTCYSNAIAELRKRCPLNKAGMIWYDQCYLDFGTLYFPDFLPIDYENSFSMHNPNNVGGDTKLFNKDMKDLFNELKIKASKNVKANEIIGYAAGEKRFGAKKLYGMVQCAQDVECKLCLESCMRELSNCCDGKQGGRVFMGRTCNLRYELYPFVKTQNIT
ncbi:unnamed protein product [Cochlearia groenlandica]